MDLFLKNIDPIVVKKIDEIEKKKRFLARTSLKVSLERRRYWERERIMTKKEKRNHKIDSQNFLHGIVEHILKKRSTTQEMER